MQRNARQGSHACSTPTCSKHVQQFLGLANFFRKFIQGYSSLAAPLTAIANKHHHGVGSPISTPLKPLGKRNAGLRGSDFATIWTQDCRSAFDAIKESLTNAPLLAHPDPTKDFRAVTDASIEGTGGVLLQEGWPIAFHSHKFSKTRA